MQSGEFQAKYTEYHVNTSLRLTELLKRRSNGTPPDTEEKYDQLLIEAEKGFKDLCGTHAKWILGYFVETRRHFTPPEGDRHPTSSDENKEKIRDVVVTVRKDSDQYDTNSIKSKDKYTIFKYICENCKPYSSNNIPKKILATDNYKHAGLDLCRALGMIITEESLRIVK
ncbi:MAG: hypothetical protein U5K00_22830 [Melioribacteraceae bacterium]|nr:hypothetical protein [Melioribacteraceae bacterium]